MTISSAEARSYIQALENLINEVNRSKPRWYSQDEAKFLSKVNTFLHLIADRNKPVALSGLVTAESFASVMAEPHAELYALFETASIHYQVNYPESHLKALFNEQTGLNAEQEIIKYHQFKQEIVNINTVSSELRWTRFLDCIMDLGVKQKLEAFRETILAHKNRDLVSGVIPSILNMNLAGQNNGALNHTHPLPAAHLDENGHYASTRHFLAYEM